jgi:hypothetical protein
VRLLVDPRASATYPLNAGILQGLVDAGVPMRMRIASGILHWPLRPLAAGAQLLLARLGVDLRLVFRSVRSQVEQRESVEHRRDQTVRAAAARYAKGGLAENAHDRRGEVGEAHLVRRPAGAHLRRVFRHQPDAAARRDEQNLGPSLTTGQYQSFTVSSLAAHTTYYWKIVSKTAAGKTKSGAVWSFTTGS